MATLRRPALQRLRDRAVSFATSLQGVRDRLASALTELAIHYSPNLIVAEQRGGVQDLVAGTGVRAGARAPDGLLLDSHAGRETRLFDLRRGVQHALLLFPGIPASSSVVSSLERLARSVAARHATTVKSHLVVPPHAGGPSDPGAAAVWQDPQGRLHERYGARRPMVYLIRPDGYIGFRGSAADPSPLLRHLAGYLKC
jgi:hypothetical protein